MTVYMMESKKMGERHGLNATEAEGRVAAPTTRSIGNPRVYVLAPYLVHLLCCLQRALDADSIQLAELARGWLAIQARS